MVDTGSKLLAISKILIGTAYVFVLLLLLLFLAFVLLFIRLLKSRFHSLKRPFVLLYTSCTNERLSVDSVYSIHHILFLVLRETFLFVWYFENRGISSSSSVSVSRTIITIIFIITVSEKENVHIFLCAFVFVLAKVFMLFFTLFTFLLCLPLNHL